MSISPRFNRRLLGCMLLSLPLLGGIPLVYAQRHPGEAGAQRQAFHEEPMRAPLGYTRVQRPHEISDNRPQFREEYRHNFRADHGVRIGPYHPPVGYEYRRWHYGEFLPRPFWAGDYILNDFWLFDLDFPPAGYEWVRFGPDALLINIGSGEIVQTVYSRFL